MDLACNVPNVATMHHHPCNTCGVNATPPRPHRFSIFSPRRAVCYGALVAAPLLVATHAVAQAPELSAVVPASGVAAPVVAAPVVDSGLARTALSYVQQRLVNWRGEGSESVAPSLAGASAVSVTLRLDGQLIARSEALGADSLEAVVTRALAQADTKIPAANDALQVQARRQMQSRVIATVELAGERLPLDATTFAQTNADVKPGVEAIVVEVGEQREVLFPLRMLHAGDLPAQAIISSIAQLSGDPAMPMPGVIGQELGDLRRTKAVRVFRAPVVQMTQLTPGGPGMLLTRGSRVVALREVNLAMLTDFRERLIDHIDTRIARTPDGSQLFATYFPYQDRADSVASPLQRAVLCATLARSTPRGAALARELLNDLIIHDARSLKEPTTAAAAVVTMAWLNTPINDDAWRAALTQSRDTLAATYANDTWADTVPTGSRAMVALALSHLATTFANEATRTADFARASAATRSLLANTTPGSLVTHMPWLGYAQQQLAGDEPIAAAPALRDMRAMIWERSLQAGTPDTADLEGGVIFGSRDPSGIAGPTWNTARPVAFVAAMLRDARFTDDAETFSQLSKLLPSLRFLRQLAIDDASAFACPQPRRAMWGVRVALWDQRQPIESSAMTLLAVSEAIESINAIALRAPAAVPAQPSK